MMSSRLSWAMGWILSPPSTAAAVPRDAAAACWAIAMRLYSSSSSSALKHIISSLPMCAPRRLWSASRLPSSVADVGLMGGVGRPCGDCRKASPRLPDPPELRADARRFGVSGGL